LCLQPPLFPYLRRERKGGKERGMPFIVRKKDVAEKLEEVYRKYRVWLDYLYRLYAQGVPVVVPSTTSIPILR